MGSIVDFYALESDKLHIDSQKIELFTKHSGTVGAFREARLRQYIKEHCGRRYTISSGFISDRANASVNISDQSSRQIDCLIYDQVDQSALIETDEFACVEPGLAAGFIEIKSSLNIYRSSKGLETKQTTRNNSSLAAQKHNWAGSLVDALQNIRSAIAINEAAGLDRHSYFAGIISYGGEKLNRLDEALKSRELMDQLDIPTLDYLPDCICILDQGWWAFEPCKWEDDQDDEQLFHNALTATYDPEISFLTKIPRGKSRGAPLQLFTSYLISRLEIRSAQSRARTGGLRSTRGLDVKAENIPLQLLSPGRIPDNIHGNLRNLSALRQFKLRLSRDKVNTRTNPEVLWNLIYYTYGSKYVGNNLMLRLSALNDVERMNLFDNIENFAFINDYL